jgi:outer membrane protein assembly factor BamA
VSQKEAIIAEIVGTHLRNYPQLHNGQKASQEEITEWIKKLYASGFEEGQLLLFLNDEKSRNQLLGHSWQR